jgi:hypothetical protein
MPFRDTLLELEEIEQLALIDRLPTHHDPPPPLKASTKRNHDSSIITSDFFNTIDPDRTLGLTCVLVLADTALMVGYNVRLHSNTVLLGLVYKM